MSLSIKIECECGQRYEFEVEPLNGRIASPVSCPACGADGTSAANEIIGRSLHPEEPSVPGTPAAPLRIGSPAARVLPVRSTVSHDSPLPGQVSRTQAQHEARAKMLWGDPPLQVLAYLMSQGFSREDAATLVKEYLKERVRTIRFKGIKNVSLGLVLVCIPTLIYLSSYFSGTSLNVRAISIYAVVGLIGLSLLIKGLFLLISPKSQSGDAADETETESLFD